MKLPFALLINANFVSSSTFHMERFQLREEIVYPQNIATTTEEPSKLEFLILSPEFLPKEKFSRAGQIVLHDFKGELCDRIRRWRSSRKSTKNSHRATWRKSKSVRTAMKGTMRSCLCSTKSWARRWADAVKKGISVASRPVWAEFSSLSLARFESWPRQSV